MNLAEAVGTVSGDNLLLAFTGHLMLTILSGFLFYLAYRFLLWQIRLPRVEIPRITWEDVQDFALGVSVLSVVPMIMYIIMVAVSQITIWGCEIYCYLFRTEGLTIVDMDICIMVDMFGNTWMRTQYGFFQQLGLGENNTRV